jgi:HEPN domain-containing protein
MQSANFAKLLLRKAEQDSYAMSRLLDDPSASDEVLGFLAQQAVEKLIKAVLTHQAIKYRRTHYLDELLALLHKSCIPCPEELSEAVALTPFAVELRYDMLPVRDDAASSFDRQWAKRCVDRIAGWATAVVEGGEG